MNDFTLQHHLDDNDVTAYQDLVAQLHSTPIPDNEILANLGLFLTRSSLARILYMAELYQKIISTHGVVIEVGVRWGQNLALFSALRSIYEPYNISRKIIGFDTFEGFVHTSDQDGDSAKVKKGAYNVVDDYEKTLARILGINESINPKSNEKKYDLIKGDVLQTVPDYLTEHPETLISLIYFDLDLYEPTKFSLEKFLPYCSHNTIFAFDELCYQDFPGETIALREVFGDRKFEVIRSPISPLQSYVKLC